MTGSWRARWGVSGGPGGGRGIDLVPWQRELLRKILHTSNPIFPVYPPPPQQFPRTLASFDTLAVMRAELRAICRASSDPFLVGMADWFAPDPMDGVRQELAVFVASYDPTPPAPPPFPPFEPIDDGWYRYQWVDV